VTRAAELRQPPQHSFTPNKRLSIEPVYTPSACLTAASAACFACRPSCCCRCSCSPLHHPVAAVMLLQPPATAGLCHCTSHLSKCPSSPSRACARQRFPPPPHAALLQRSRRASHCIPHNHHERKRFTRTRWDEEHQRCRDRAQQLAAPAPRVHRRAFGASRVFACFQNQRGVFRSCGASPCSADPSAALARGTHEHRCVAAACCGVQRSFERAACAEADLLSK